MPEILTTNYKTDNTRLFANDVLNNNYYLFVSSIGTTVSENSARSKMSFLEKTLFGKKFLNDDVKYVIKYYPWQRGTIYAQYDDNTNLDDLNFYATVGPNNNDTGDYRVYKCLNNNFGSPVTSPPAYSDVTVDQIYNTADGYIWKFMYVLTANEFDAYNASGYIPLIGDFNTEPPLVSGSPLSNIKVENKNTNFGYNEEIGDLGTFTIPNGSTTTAVLRVSPRSEWNRTTNFYAGQSIYITNTNDGTSFVYEITSYNYNTGISVPEIRVKANEGEVITNDLVGAQATFKILPRVKIQGDGFGAIAISNIVNNRIDSITILNKGSGYKNVIVSIVDPISNFEPDNIESPDTRAIVRGVLAPINDHGYDFLEEFKCRHILLYAYITEDNNNQIGATNTYGTIGVIKNPNFANTSPVVFDNRISIVTDDVSSVLINTTITQVDNNNEIVFSGTVHEVDTTSNTIYVAEYSGPYQNGANTDISLNATLPLRSESGQTIRINTPTDQNIITSEYIQRTGEVYFMEDFFPLARTDSSREEFKLVLEF
jgi:hypothetical protein